MTRRSPLQDGGGRPRPAPWAVALLVASAAFLLVALALLLFRAGPGLRNDAAHARDAAGARSAPRPTSSPIASGLEAP